MVKYMRVCQHLHRYPKTLTYLGAHDSRKKIAYEMRDKINTPHDTEGLDNNLYQYAAVIKLCED